MAFMPPPDDERPALNPVEDRANAPVPLPPLPPPVSNLEPRLWPTELDMDPERMERKARRATPSYATTEFLLTGGCAAVNGAAALALLLTRRIGGTDASWMLAANGGVVGAYVLGRSWVKARGGAR